jgi:hypothetical protein
VIPSLSPKNIPETGKKVTVSVAFLLAIGWVGSQLGAARAQLEAGFQAVREVQVTQGSKLDRIEERLRKQEVEALATQREAAEAQRAAAKAKEAVEELESDVRATRRFGGR